MERPEQNDASSESHPILFWEAIHGRKLPSQKESNPYQPKCSEYSTSCRSIFNKKYL
jgi:hypothetical protein